MSKARLETPAKKAESDLRSRIKKMPDGPAKDQERARLADMVLGNKRAKLIELSGKRVSVAIKRISLVGNLAAYKPTEAEAEKIVEALEAAVGVVRTRLKITGEKTVPMFSL